MTKQKKVVTRMAPSPTGRFHVGGVRTAFYNYAFAKKHGGSFILRIEDTDKERNREEYEQEIYDVFTWVGLEYDAVYRQSEHLTRHQEVLAELIASGHAYEGEAAKDGTGNVIRFKNPNKKITFQDQILGEISVDTTDLGDFVIARNPESPLYHLAVVVDDHDEEVTHVIRAQEHVANTPRQILLHEALGWNTPIYAHVPFILGPDGKKKLSKRDTNVAAMDYREAGYLPQALLNFLAFIGWNPGTDQELFTKEELIGAFSLEQVQKSPGGFNLEKLDWLNKQWLNTMNDETFISYINSETGKWQEASPAMLKKIVPLIRERIHNTRELREMIEKREFEYFFTEPTYAAEQLVWKKSNTSDTRAHLMKTQKFLEELKDWSTPDLVKEQIWPYADEQGRGDVLWPLRFALSGKEKSPDPFTLAHLLGKEKTLERINSAIDKLS